MELDDRNESIGKKIRQSQMEKVPYSVVVGDKEVENGTVSVRKRGGVDMGAMSVNDFAQFILKEIKDKVIS